MSHSWDIMDEPAAEGCCSGCNSAFKQSTMIEIHISENPRLRSLSLKKETVQNFKPYTQFCFFRSITTTAFLHCFLLSQLETTFGGAVSERKLLKFIIFFRFLHYSQIPVIFPVNLHSSISLYRAIATHLITMCSTQKHGFDSHKSAKLA